MSSGFRLKSVSFFRDSPPARSAAVNTVTRGPPRQRQFVLKQLIEVATAQLRRKVGTRVVHDLMERHSGRRLFAYSEEADEFWASLGWQRFDHPEGPQFHRPLFIQSAR